MAITTSTASRRPRFSAAICVSSARLRATSFRIVRRTATGCTRKRSMRSSPGAPGSSSRWTAASPPSRRRQRQKTRSISSSPITTCRARNCPKPSPSSIRIVQTAHIPTRTSRAWAWHSNSAKRFGRKCAANPSRAILTSSPWARSPTSCRSLGRIGRSCSKVCAS